MPTPASFLADLATRYPAASRVFHEHRLDYCCGGRRSLADACAERGLDPNALLDALTAAGPGEVDVTALTPGDLAAHIVTTYHEPLRDELPRLTQMAAKVERVHGEKPGCPSGLSAHLATWGEDVLEHLDKEETSLFPALAEVGSCRELVSALEREHDDHAAALVRTRELTNDLVAPITACTTWRALYLGLDQLERDLMAHVHLENHVLFPHAARGSSAGV